MTKDNNIICLAIGPLHHLLLNTQLRVVSLFLKQSFSAGFIVMSTGSLKACSHYTAILLRPDTDGCKSYIFPVFYSTSDRLAHCKFAATSDQSDRGLSDSTLRPPESERSLLRRSRDSDFAENPLLNRGPLKNETFFLFLYSFLFIFNIWHFSKAVDSCFQPLDLFFTNFNNFYELKVSDATR